MSWFNYFHEELAECIDSIEDIDTIYLYEASAYAVHNELVPGEWYVQDFSNIEDYLWCLECEIVVSSKDIEEIDKLAIINL